MSIKKATPAGIAIIGFIIMSQVMSGTGQIIVLAEGISQVLGETYALFAAGIGMLGSFMTSSNMSSNILFGKFQQTAAELLELAPGPVLGAQTTGATIGTIISPGNIILGTTTAGVLGQEGKILKKVLPMSLIIVSLIGIVLYLCLVFF